VREEKLKESGNCLKLRKETEESRLANMDAFEQRKKVKGSVHINLKKRGGRKNKTGG